MLGGIFMMAWQAVRALTDDQAPAFQPLYVVYGPQEYWASQWIRLVTQRFLGADEDGRHLFEGAIDFTEVRLRLATEGFFASRQLVVIRQGKWPKKEESLKAYVKNPITDAILILREDKLIPGWKEWLPAAALIEAAVMPEDAFRQFVADAAKTRRLRFPDAALNQFAALVYPDEYHAINELDKLALMPLREPWSAERIRAEVIPWHHEESLWDVVDLIVQGKRAEAIRRVMQMLNDGAAPLMLLVVFARRLTEIERARQWQKAGRSAPEWEQQAGYKGFHAKRLWQAAQKWDARRLELLTDWAFRIDRAMKTGYGDAADWLIFWLGLLPETQNKSPRRVRGA